MREYGVYNLDGELIYRGDVDDIVTSLDTKRNTVYVAVKNGFKVKRKYYVREIGTKKTMYEEQLDYLIRHLDRYGNTVIPSGKKPSDFLEELEKRGYICEVKTYKNYVGENITLDRPNFSKRKIDYDYILELRR